MIVKLLTEHHLEFLSLKGGCTGSSESTLVKMLHFWKSHVTAQLRFVLRPFFSTVWYVGEFVKSNYGANLAALQVY